jgi:hypothetical protein
MNENIFQPSSRLQALVNGTYKSSGASCNTFVLDDTIESIGDGLAWALQVSAHQGAPSIDFSRLRERGALLSTGGRSNGAIVFMKGYDSLMSGMLRAEKKNSASIAFLNYNHPDIKEFLNWNPTSCYKGVYLPMHDTPEAARLLADDEKVTMLTKAYDEFKCFLVKRPDDNLLVNLCTEVEIPHRGSCVLGAINLSGIGFLHDIPRYMAEAMEEMVKYQKLTEASQLHSPLYCPDPKNKQVGLGMLGLASLMSRLGISYTELGIAMRECILHSDTIEDMIDASAIYTQKPAYVLLKYILRGYQASAKVAKSAGLRAAFCLQPTPSTAMRVFDVSGYNVSPEIAPVIGLSKPDGVYGIRKSAVKGDVELKYHPGTATLDNTEYSDYALVSSMWQKMMESTGLAHRHSHCFHGEKFTKDDFYSFYQGERRYIKSMYYRHIWQSNTEALDKSELWQTVSDNELFDGDISSILQMPGTMECTACAG